MRIVRSVEEEDVIAQNTSPDVALATIGPGNLTVTQTIIGRINTTAPDDDPLFTADGVTWAVVGAVFCVVVFLVATLCYIKKKHDSPKAKKKRRLKKELIQKAKEEKHVQDVSRDPIPVQVFPDILRQKNKDTLLHVEFKALARLQEQYSCDDALLPENRCKNAYPEVLPDDNNRVLLEPIQGQPGSDYINATYIDGYKKVNAYIATQGPKTQTVVDFWRMVWQEGVHCIVMATNLFEHARQQCEKYWHNTYQQFGSIHVALEETETTADFTIRTFRISQNGCDGERQVKQFQLSSWNELDCPDTSAVLEFRRRISVYTKNLTGPMVVHCSNGAGRTGTFIAIDILLDRLCMEDSLDVFNCVLSLRNARSEMVANMQQYMFIFECISMHIQCDVTVIPVVELPAVVQKLMAKDPQTRLSGLEREMKVLDMVVPKLQVGECAGGHRLENRRKSRDIMIQPPERARPYLITFDSSDSSDFINACYVDSYRRQNAFIVTQWPTRNTVNDIWRLIFDYHIATVVLLNDMPESRSCPKFWPDQYVGEWQRYGPINVSYQGTQNFPNITARTFHVKKKRIYVNVRVCLGEAAEALANPLGNMRKGRLLEEEAKIVQIFQLTCWPNSHKVPSDCQALMELVNMAENWQNMAADRNSPICVMSKNGVSRVGLYCAISYACEKLRFEGEVDIFHAVKVVKMNRPQLVENLSEYTYCYTFCVRMLDAIMAQSVAKLSSKTRVPSGAPQPAVKQVAARAINDPVKTSTPGEGEKEKALADYKGFDHYSFIAQRVEEYRRQQKERALQSHSHVHYRLPDKYDEVPDIGGRAPDTTWLTRNGHLGNSEMLLDPGNYKMQEEELYHDQFYPYAGGRKFDYYFESYRSNEVRRDSVASYATALDGKRNSVDQRRISYVGSHGGTEGYYSCDSRRSSYASASDLSQVDQVSARDVKVHTNKGDTGLSCSDRRSSFTKSVDGQGRHKRDYKGSSHSPPHYLFDHYHDEVRYNRNSNNNYIRHNDIYSDPVLQRKLRNYNHQSYAYHNKVDHN